MIILSSNKLCTHLALTMSSILILIGSFIAMYVIIIGGQAYPLTIFPDHIIIDSSFFDNVVHSYIPSVYEFGLGIGGVALALIIVLVGIANFKFLPTMISSLHKKEADKKSSDS